MKQVTLAIPEGCYLHNVGADTVRGKWARIKHRDSPTKYDYCSCCDSPTLAGLLICRNCT